MISASITVSYGKAGHWQKSNHFFGLTKEPSYLKEIDLFSCSIWIF